MRKIRLVVVDDSAVVRRVLTEVLSADPEIEVVGAAHNGQAALAEVAKKQPDIVTLDVEMPIMDGLECLEALRKGGFRKPVIMCSTLTERGAAVTIDALSLGASDYIAKPNGRQSANEACAYLQAQLIPKIKALCGRGDFLAAPRGPRAGAPPSPNRPPVPRNANGQRPLALSTARIDVVAIGLSTGGPNALQELLPKLQPDFPVPIVIVQHMPPVFTRHLAERLAARSRLPVAEARPGAVLRPGEIWIAPGDFHMEVAPAERTAEPRMLISLHQRPPENSCRPAVDVLFRSIAAHYGPRALGIVLTGMGHDGVAGGEQISQAGGQIWVEDQSTSVVWGMPGAMVRAGLADRVYPLPQFAPELTNRAWVGRVRMPMNSLAGSR